MSYCLKVPTAGELAELRHRARTHLERASALRDLFETEIRCARATLLALDDAEKVENGRVAGPASIGDSLMSYAVSSAGFAAVLQTAFIGRVEP